MWPVLVVWCGVYLLLRVVQIACRLLSYVMPGGDEAFALFFGSANDFYRVSPMRLVDHARRFLRFLFHCTCSLFRFLFAKGR